MSQGHVSKSFEDIEYELRKPQRIVPFNSKSERLPTISLNRVEELTVYSTENSKLP